jgi:hypothetical protein
MCLSQCQRSPDTGKARSRIATEVHAATARLTRARRGTAPAIATASASRPRSRQPGVGRMRVAHRTSPYPASAVNVTRRTTGRSCVAARARARGRGLTSQRPSPLSVAAPVLIAPARASRDQVLRTGAVIAAAGAEHEALAATH